MLRCCAFGEQQLFMMYLLVILMKALKLTFPRVFPVVLMVFALGCAEDRPPDMTNHADRRTLRIVFKWPGDDMAGRKALEDRDRIARRIVQAGIGKLIRSGTGMGWMDILVEVDDRESARTEIEQIVRELSPDSKFDISLDPP